MTDSEQIGFCRDVTPPKPILIRIDGRWWPGRLDRWAREADGWYGRATLDHGSAVSWYPSSALRSPDPERTEIGSADS
jgi:hypothetical protein